MITIYHGEDTVKSRKEFIDTKTVYSDAVSLYGTTVTPTDLVQLFEGNDLFATGKKIFIEDFFSKRKTGKETDQILSIINQHPTEASIFFWESKELTQKQLKQMPRASAQLYKLPQVIFAFLDEMKPGNAQKLILLFHKALTDQDASFVFAMLVRQFRLFIALKEIGEQSIEEIRRMAPWQRAKLQKQVQLFDKNDLLKNYKSLYKIEKAIKTGTLSQSLEQAIDFFLVQL